MKTYTSRVIYCPLFKWSIRTNFDGLAMSWGERNSQRCTRFVMKLKMKGKRPSERPRLRWIDNIDSHLKGKNTSLKEDLETKCFENRKGWRTLISWSTDRSSREDWTPIWSMVSRWAFKDTAPCIRNQCFVFCYHNMLYIAHWCVEITLSIVIRMSANMEAEVNLVNSWNAKMQSLLHSRKLDIVDGESQSKVSNRTSSDKFTLREW